MKIGVDIGGTNIRIVAADDAQNGLLIGEVSFPNSENYELNIQKIRDEIDRFSTDISSIGISTPGTFNEDGSVMIRSTNMPQWVNQPSITSRLSEEFDCNIQKANDTACAALGEAHNRKSTSPFFYISYGTGISGAWVNYDDGVPHAERVTDEVQANHFHNWKDCSGANIEKEFSKPGDAISKDEWNVIMNRLSNHLKVFMNEFVPAEVVFGGGIAHKQADIIELMLQDFRVIHPEYAGHRFTFATLGEKSALYGAIALLNKS